MANICLQVNYNLLLPNRFCTLLWQYCVHLGNELLQKQRKVGSSGDQTKDYYFHVSYFINQDVKYN